MKRITLIIIAVLFSITAFAQQTFNTDFTQTKVMKVSGKTTNKTGHILFDGKDQLKMIYSEPEGDYFIIEGNLVRINMDGKKADLDANKVKMVGLQRATLLNCLSGNWEQAAADNKAETTITEDNGLKKEMVMMIISDIDNSIQLVEKVDTALHLCRDLQGKIAVHPEQLI